LNIGGGGRGRGSCTPCKELNSLARVAGRSASTKLRAARSLHVSAHAATAQEGGGPEGKPPAGLCAAPATVQPSHSRVRTAHAAPAPARCSTERDRAWPRQIKAASTTPLPPVPQPINRQPHCRTVPDQPHSSKRGGLPADAPYLLGDRPVRNRARLALPWFVVRDEHWARGSQHTSSVRDSNTTRVAQTLLRMYPICRSVRAPITQPRNDAAISGVMAPSVDCDVPPAALPHMRSRP
jgi:hypothetical protein